MRRILVLASASLVFGLSQSATAQQNPNLEQGLKPFGSYQSGDVDSVSLTNGNLALHIPLVSYPQRGGKLKLGFLIRYNNKGWQVQQFTSGGQTYQHWVWQGSGAEVVRDQELRLKQTTLRVTDQITFEQVFVTLSDALSPDGSSHQLETVTNGTTAEAVDTSGIALNTALVDRDGIRYTQGGGSASLSYATVVEDPNGNKITAGSNGWTDTLGRLIPGSIPTDSSYGASGNGFVLPGIATADVSLCPSGTTRARNWYLPGPSGGSSLIKLCYTSILA